MSRMTRVARTITVSTIAITIHWVRIEDVMLGWNWTMPELATSGARSQITCGAGSSRLAPMPSAGNLNAPLSPRERAPRRARRGSIVALAALCVIVHPGEEPADKQPDRPSPDPHPDEQADQDKDRDGPQIRVRPIADTHARQGRHEQDEPDFREEGEIGHTAARLDHGPPGNDSPVPQRVSATRHAKVAKRLRRARSREIIGGAAPSPNLGGPSLRLPPRAGDAIFGEGGAAAPP